MNVVSYREQALRYLARPHEGPRKEATPCDAQWYGETLARNGDWIETLDANEIAEIEAAVGEIEARGIALGDVDATNFPLPQLAPRIAGWRRELAVGRGFVVLRGLPVERWGEARSGFAYWALGQHLGEAGAQNPAGELLGHVTDTGDDARDPFVRRYKTAGDIAFHCDLADVVGLLCLRPARSGGASRIASSVSIHDALLDGAPELAARLYEPMHLDRRGEHARGEAPTLAIPPCRHAGGQLRTFWHSDYFRSAPRHPEVPDFDPTEQALLDRYEALANAPEFRLDMDLQAGDIQFLSNHVCVHARTAYEDDPAHPRHLLRLWLSLPAETPAAAPLH